MPDALIIGGAGFIGRRLAKSLLAEGKSVEIVDILSQTPVDIRSPLPDWLSGDAGTVLYFLAAVHRTPGHPDTEYFRTNVDGARHVAAFAERRGIRQIVFTSSIAVYGPDEREKDEDALPAPVTAYGRSKLQAERILSRWQRAASGRQLVIARPAVVFGPGESGNFTRLANALRYRFFAYPGRRDTVKGCCFVDDLIDSFGFALDTREDHFLYNFAYPHPYTIEAICDAFHQSGGLPRPVGVVPAGALRIAAALAEGMAAMGIQTGINRARLAKLTSSTRIAPAQLLRLGYQFPTDLRNALTLWRDEVGAFR
jgi:nucleoside-diphosphate-sugar epimerase